ncbi:hypothetical protein SA2016_3464 [Sinomonas atrocyanea]|uniref:Uncharacterized protein n=1 Tax=Sinomonas atrocyanea TaxID=37927 RepID=A0A127A5S1_9MICC|nr:hypothetical protein [Sinomonas atrocyanea]AMM34124.1 hypothetical protein SA2016_3464 [Sinomonas atrocyanea]GEB65172.1 hypothetical protein SAT01_26200 [Sinomonas atrocyanea]GGG58576.1 hypothetical protein GCM10007172_06790 [Sinomonas atrocyanea]
MKRTSALKTNSGRGQREDWSRLIGRTVEVWLEGQLVATGEVEQATADDSVLWLAPWGVQRRKLYDKWGGYSVWA